MDTENKVALVVAVMSIIGAVLISATTRRHDRQQAARTLMIRPAEDFARQAYKMLAALRYVTPPDTAQHRNAALLEDKDVREKRLAACHVMLDDLRGTRASIALMFGPKSAAAEYARCVLDRLRFCLEICEAFYERHTAAGVPTNRWQASPSSAWRERYKQLRETAYNDDLKRLFEDVADRMVSPSWNAAPFSGEPVDFRDERAQLKKFRRGEDEGPIPRG